MATFALLFGQIALAANDRFPPNSGVCRDAAKGGFGDEAGVKH